MPNLPAYLIVHHTAVSRGKNAEQFEAVRGYHLRKGWGDIGYHYFIEPDGTVKKGRAENSVGAHTKQKLMNYRSLGIALAGNFDSENPTELQLKALAKLLKKLRTKYNLPVERVAPHRYYATYKSCPGTRFTDQMLEQLARGEVETFTPPAWAEAGVAWAAEQKILTQITGEPISDYRLAAILYNFVKSKVAQL